MAVVVVVALALLGWCRFGHDVQEVGRSLVIHFISIVLVGVGVVLVEWSGWL